jgi:hypothetical protein
MDRLHAKGMISDRVGKAKSVVFSEEGLRRSEQLFNQLFGAHHISTNRTCGLRIQFASRNSSLIRNI